ncbi:MAG: DUF2141 domain-containing protein [Bacteroidota bacterium]
MKQIVLIAITAIAFMNFTPANVGKVTVELTGIEKTEGQIVFMLFDQEDGFPSDPNKALKKGIVNEYSDKATFTFDDVPYGTYALAVFHDENSDGEVERNFMGMPKESVGASNMFKMGRPNFEKCSFELKEGEKKLNMVFII